MGDKADFAGVHYTELGIPYQRPKDEDENAVTVESLTDHAVKLPRGVAPSPRRRCGSWSCPHR